MCKDLGNNVYQCNGNCGGGSVWGSGIYTSDSNLWAAAKHMGYLPGVFTKIPAPGLLGYRGTSANGITTSSYDNYGGSYFLFKGVYNGGDTVNLVKQEITSLQQKITSLSTVEQNLKNMITNHENTIKALQQKSVIKDQQIISLSQKVNKLLVIQQENAKKLQKDKKIEQSMIQSTSASLINTISLQTQMKNLYISEMTKYNQNIIKMLTQKDYLPCTMCNQNKREAMVLPCTHAQYCKQYGKCNTCSQQIKGFIQFQL